MHKATGARKRTSGASEACNDECIQDSCCFRFLALRLGVKPLSSGGDCGTQAASSQGVVLSPRCVVGRKEAQEVRASSQAADLNALPNKDPLINVGPSPACQIALPAGPLQAGAT
jgi:hypothetical protein